MTSRAEVFVRWLLPHLFVALPENSWEKKLQKVKSHEFGSLNDNGRKFFFLRCIFLLRLHYLFFFFFSVLYYTWFVFEEKWRSSFTCLCMYVWKCLIQSVEFEETSCDDALSRRCCGGFFNNISRLSVSVAGCLSSLEALGQCQLGLSAGPPRPWEDKRYSLWQTNKKNKIKQYRADVCYDYIPSTKAHVVEALINKKTILGVYLSAHSQFFSFIYCTRRSLFVVWLCSALVVAQG